MGWTPAELRRLFKTFQEVATPVIAKLATEGASFSEKELDTFLEAYNAVYSSCELASITDSACEEVSLDLQRIFDGCWGPLCKRLLATKMELLQYEELAERFQKQARALLHALANETGPVPSQEDLDSFRGRYKNVTSVCDELIRLSEKYPASEQREMMANFRELSGEMFSSLEAAARTRISRLPDSSKRLESSSELRVVPGADNESVVESGTRAGTQLSSVIRDERECPYCAEWILKKARLCKHCGSEVEPQVETSIA